MNEESADSTTGKTALSIVLTKDTVPHYTKTYLEDLVLEIAQAVDNPEGDHEELAAKIRRVAGHLKKQPTLVALP